jgi:starch synthase (maltosyl-transferring)
MTKQFTHTGQKRVIIEQLKPEINGGQFPVKRVVGDTVEVTAFIFADGHDRISANLLHRKQSESQWQSVPFVHDVNDEWHAAFRVEELGIYVYSAQAWIDPFSTWQHDIQKKIEAGQKITVDVEIGCQILAETIERADKADIEIIKSCLQQLQSETDPAKVLLIAEDIRLSALMRQYPDPSKVVSYPRELAVRVSCQKAVFSTWYELFPRSCGVGHRHGTFADAEQRLPEIAKMGFDVLYLPPIHPIGKTNRKGRNNSPRCMEDDPGSPWAIGAAEGGHTAIHPELGTRADLKKLKDKAQEYGIEMALDIAFQCTPDHPYVNEHPEWFRWRPDGSVQYAENPPKKYEDILPLNFETDAWQSLWEELRRVVMYWIEQGFRIFRVDNPHTKALDFWEWLIEQVYADYPGVIFLSEAFTRPKVMQRLAKVGFTQSYTYFTWRNTKYELEHYMQHLTQTDVAEYLRPNFWPNTPDILPEYLQFGGRPAFIVRLVLAATLSSNYGIYGPAFELCEARALEGKEEYLDSEKYEIKDWDLNQKGNIKAVIERVNRIRKENTSLQQTRNIRFLETDNETLIAYSKTSNDGLNTTVMAVNLDPHHRQSGWIHIPLNVMDIPEHQSYLMHDLIGGGKYIWQGEWNYIELDPQILPAHIMGVRKRMKRENDFDYFM